MNQDFIECLRAYLKGEKLNKILDDKDLIDLALEQSLQTILYPVYNDIVYKKYYVGWVVKQEEFLSLQKEITSLFNLNYIKHFYTKGSLICDLYDDVSIRTRGDIDVFVSFADVERARDILILNGFISKQVTRHDYPLYKNNLLIELHYSLFDEEIDKTWNKYFSDPFYNSKQVTNSLYALDDTYHLIYCVAHFAKHLRLGAGIRYILDFYYMLSKTNIDYDRLHKELKVLKLEKLYKNILNVIYYISDISFDVCTKENCDEFIEYMLKSGIHGFGEHNDNDFTLAHAKKHKFRFILSRIFLTNKEYRKLRFPKLFRWYLYPICLFVNIFYLLTHRLGTLIKFVFKKNNNKKIYKKIGI